MNKIIESLKNKKVLKMMAILFIVISMFLIGWRLKIGGGIAGGDSIRYYTYLKTIAFDNNLDFESNFDYFRNDRSKFTGLVKYPEPKNTGKDIMIYPLGTTIAWYPFFIFGNLVGNVFYWITGNSSYISGFSMAHYYFVSLSALFYILLGVWLIYYYFVKWGNDKLLTGLSIAGITLGTALTYYIYFIPTYSHVLSFFWVTYFLLYFLDKYKYKNFHGKDFFILGLLLAMVYLTRYQDVLIAIIPLYLLVYDLLVDKNKYLLKTYKFWFLAIIGFFIVILLQLLINKYINGSYLLTGYYNQPFSYLLNPKIFFTLFNLNEGILTITPILIFAVLGILLNVKSKLNQALLLFFLVQVYVVSAWGCYDQGESYGNRMTICCSIVYIFGLMPILAWLKVKKRWLPYFFTFLFVCLNWLFMVLYAFRIIGEAY